MRNPSITTHPALSAPARNRAILLSPNRQMLCFLAFMVMLWTVLCAVSHRSPDADGMEQLVWAASLELGYYKHPPFPTWVMYLLTHVFGRPYWLSFFAGMLSSALGLWFVWLLGKEMATARHAFIATALVSTTIYFSSRGTIYNHNTAQFWSITASTWLLYRALRYRQACAWLWLGVVSALAVMTKYSIVLQWAGFFLFMLRQRCFAQAGTWKGLGMAAAAFVVCVSPHLWWLFDHRFLPLDYAGNAIDMPSRLQGLLLIIHFALDQLARLSPMLAVWLAWLWWARISAGRAKSAAADSRAWQPAATERERPTRYIHHFDEWDRSFLLWVGLTPVIATLLASALMGTRLIASWATTFFVL
ncbi:MAG: glycosyltransferase family 39 protein, partial [Candidimonas sp.]